VQNIKMLGITFTNSLYVTPYVQHLATYNAQILYALKILHAHGLCRMAKQVVFHSVILARLLYASPAWWGFPGAQNRQTVYSFLGQNQTIVCAIILNPISTSLYVIKHVLQTNLLHITLRSHRQQKVFWSFRSILNNSSLENNSMALLTRINSLMMIMKLVMLRRSCQL